jgi:hypothetical protein
MLNDTHILDAARYVVNLPANATLEESARRLAYALRLIYDASIANAIAQIKTELAENEMLITATKVIVPDAPKIVGRTPWFMRQAELEKRFRKQVDAKADTEDALKEEKYIDDIRENTAREPEID